MEWEYDANGNLVPKLYGGGLRGRSTNPILAEAGVGTEGPMHEEAAETATNYSAPSVRGQAMPQQFGTAEPARDEGPLTPRETAEAMPKTTQDMNRLINQHILRGPKPPTVSGDGRQNDLTAKREAEASEKAQRMQQAELNRAAGAQKSQNAWDQTLRLNALQGAGPMAGGGGGYGGGGFTGNGYGGNNRVQRIGGYAFVSGTWRPADSMEQAKINNVNSDAEYNRQRPGIAAAAVKNRAEEGRLNREQDQSQFEANQKRLQDSQAAKMLDEELEELEDDRFELDNIFADMKSREGIAATKTPKGPNKGEFTKYLDTDFTKLDPDPMDPNKKAPRHRPGSYEIMKRRLQHLAKKINKAKKDGKYKSDLPPEILALIEEVPKPVRS